MDRTGASVVLPIFFSGKKCGETPTERIPKVISFWPRDVDFTMRCCDDFRKDSLNWVRMFQQKTKNKTRRRSWSFFHKLNLNIRVEKSLTVSGYDMTYRICIFPLPKHSWVAILVRKQPTANVWMPERFNKQSGYDRIIPSTSNIQHVLVPISVIFQIRVIISP